MDKPIAVRTSDATPVVKGKRGSVILLSIGLLATTIGPGCPRAIAAGKIANAVVPPGGVSIAGVTVLRLPLSELRSILVDDPMTSVFSPSGFRNISDGFNINASPAMDRLHSPAGFQAMIEAIPAARQALMQDMRIQTDLIKGAKNLALFSLVQVMGSDKPLAEKFQDADALSKRYAEFFDGVGTDPSMPSRTRRQAIVARDRLLDPKHVIEGLAVERQLHTRVMLLDRTVHALNPAAPIAEQAEPERTISPPLPKSRLKQEEAPHSWRVTMADLRNGIEGALCDLGRVDVRTRLAKNPRFSEALRTKILEETAYKLDRIKPYLDYWKSSVARFSGPTIGASFMADKTHRIIHVPKHPGLSLIPEPGGFLLRARFKTDLQDPTTRRLIKKSIESYWHGRFTYLGRAYRLRTRISIEPLRPGESFPPDYLELVDAKGGISRAGSSRIVLGDVTFDVPAHEFGHILGLNDEYKESYDPDAHAGNFTMIRGSLMGSHDGSVLARHLKLAYQLLRRHRLLAASTIK